MDKKSFCKLTISLFLLTFICPTLFSQTVEIDYLGIVSTELDQNMSKMTSDLYYTQLNEIQDLSVSDKRTENNLESIPDNSELAQNKLTFYTEILKSDKTDKWITVVHLVNPASSQESIKKTEYDSFYKILMESKNTLKDTIYDLLGEKVENSIKNESSVPSEKIIITSTENLSGTWAGEDFIDKIVIMRGGRGFIIFNNGASMTISIELDNSSSEQKIVISQKGRSNASFYPNLPRSIAVNAALEAEPLIWQFYTTDSNTLSGTKKTLTQQGESFAYITENVKWTRVNN